MRTIARLGLMVVLTACGGDVEDATAEAMTGLTTVDAEGRLIDVATGLVRAVDWELVAANCIPCHSTQQLTRQRGTASTWQQMIDWMQATQGLWEFPPGVEARIVDYLATHYGPSGAWRRAPLPADLMPPNPYASEIRRDQRSR